MTTGIAIVKEWMDGTWYCTRGIDDGTEYLNSAGEWTQVDDKVQEEDGAFLTLLEAEAAMKAEGHEDFKVQTKEEFFDPVTLLLLELAKQAEEEPST